MRKSNKQRKSKKIGRNDRCICGSGIKYKKCCHNSGFTVTKVSEVPKEVLDEHDQAIKKRQSILQDKGIYIDLPNTATFQGKSFLAVGNKVMWDKNPHATFHELTLRNLSQTLGEQWWDAESIKPLEERHYIKRCFESLKGLNNRDDLDVTVIDEHTHTMLATGDAKALLNLAFDVWLLTQKSYLRDDWLNRLRDFNEYQGVRYEIGVASLFVRIGCELEFYDSDKPDENGKLPKRAEFIAIHSPTKNRVAVEAKSRHVKGVMHTPGTMNDKHALKGDITKLYKQALLKVTDDLPLIIFIDVNSPTESSQTVQNTQWFADVKRSFDSRPTPTPENPDKFSSLFVTNFSSHYPGNNVSHPGQYLFIGSMCPEYPLVDGHLGEFMKRLLRAVGNYSYVPPSMDNSKIAVYESPTISSKEDFIDKLRNLTLPQKDDHEYKQRKIESDNLIDMLVWDATQKSGGEWNNEIATECFKQFKWLNEQS